jgi:hypothetical protein
MLFARRLSATALLAAVAAACSAPDTAGLFDPTAGPASGATPASASCVATCLAAAVRCTLVDLPCDAICATAPSAQQMSCIETSRCELVDGQSVAQRCLKIQENPGIFGTPCDCGGPESCRRADQCRGDLLCFDPGGPDPGGNATSLFPGFCSRPCDPPPGARTCPEGFVCRRQKINDADPIGAEKYWCER